MVRRRSQKALEKENLTTEAVYGVRSGRFESCYAAAKALGLSRNTVTQRVAGRASVAEARQKQQHLTGNQEKLLLKWIKQLTVSGYAPGYQLLREIADEIRADRS
jgi:hypothetical protein